MPFLGPAFIAAVAYVDPGHFATNISGGAQLGYLLLWVILTSNLMAILIQSMSAKPGIVTGKNLPEVCRAPFPRAITSGLRSAHDLDSLLYSPTVVEEAFSEVPTILILFSPWSLPALIYHC